MKNCKEYLKENYLGRLTLPKSASNMFMMKYAPKTDKSPAFNVNDASYFESLTIILPWTVEIGSIDIVTEISMLLSHLAYP